MIDALATRYDKDPGAEREPLDRAYYEAMKNVAGLYPETVEALTLAAAAYMNTTCGDDWDKQGRSPTMEMKTVKEWLHWIGGHEAWHTAHIAKSLGFESD